MEITTVIADDEPLARDKLRLLLQRDPMFRIVAECATGREVIQAIYAHKPQVVFLDVQMPDLDGLAALQSVDALAQPLVVLTTAYADYAVAAFDAEVLDYLLKPFDEDRLQRCLRRLKSRLLHGAPHAERGGGGLRKPAETMDRFLVRSEGRILFLDARDIDWIEAAANYVEIHSGSQSYLVRHTMNELEKRLDARKFVRIHRSYIVNAAKIRGVLPCNTGEHMVQLHNGKELPSSRGYRENLEAILKNAI